MSATSWEQLHVERVSRLVGKAAGRDTKGREEHRVESPLVMERAPGLCTRLHRNYCRRKAAERAREVEGSEMAFRRTLHISPKLIPAYLVELQAVRPGA